MGREEDILTAIDELDRFFFQKLARRFLQRELYPDLNPLPEQNDLGQDASTEELPVLIFLPFSRNLSRSRSLSQKLQRNRR